MHFFLNLIYIYFYRGIMCSGGGVNHYVSGVIASMLQENIEDEYLDKIIKIYRVHINFCIYISLNTLLI